MSSRPNTCLPLPISPSVPRPQHIILQDLFGTLCSSHRILSLSLSLSSLSVFRPFISPIDGRRRGRFKLEQPQQSDHLLVLLRTLRFSLRKISNVISCTWPWPPTLSVCAVWTGPEPSPRCSFHGSVRAADDSSPAAVKSCQDSKLGAGRPADAAPPQSSASTRCLLGSFIDQSGQK